MRKLKLLFLRALSIGVHPGLSTEKKLALQIAALDSYWTFLAAFFYVFYTVTSNTYPLYIFHSISFFLIALGIWLLWKRHYDASRFLVQLTGLAEIFINADATGANGGYEFYYFTSILVPFVIFTSEEYWKGLILTAIATSLLLIQLIVGKGLFLPIVDTPPEEKLISIAFVVSYLVIVLSVGRWQAHAAQKKLKREQKEVSHSSSLMAIGEMFAGMAHEINNPLQTLALHLTVLRAKCQEWGHREESEELLTKIESIVLKVGKIVQGLKNLSRKDPNAPKETFLFTRILDEVLVLNSERALNNGVSIHITGDSEVLIHGDPIQLSQVLINLINNAMEAIVDHHERWIRIDVSEKNSLLYVAVTDSGMPPSSEIAVRMMDPFFSTKGSKGTGLGLSISKSIIEKNGGSLYFDSTSNNTRFVFLVPRVDA